MNLQTQIDDLNAALDALDQDNYGDDDSPDPKVLFGKVFLTHVDEIGDRRIATRECESVKLNGAAAFYRLLFLAQPKQLDFSDMYKSGSLFALVSPNGEFVADIEFWKYEPCVRFSAAPEHVDVEQRIVFCGIPGQTTAVTQKTPELKAWMALLQRCLDRKWMMYSGNDFEV
jgi:hypothetical protein